MIGAPFGQRAMRLLGTCWSEECNEEKDVIREVLEKTRKRANAVAWGLRHGVDVFPRTARACPGHHDHVGLVRVIVFADFNKVAIGEHGVETVGDLPGKVRAVTLSDRPPEQVVLLILIGI